MQSSILYRSCIIFIGANTYSVYNGQMFMRFDSLPGAKLYINQMLAMQVYV